jgi:hypothetical protein
MRAFRLLLLSSMALPAVTLEVRPGEDPAAAIAKARELRRTHPGEAVEIVFADGVHRLARPLLLGPEDSGTAAAPLLLAAAPGAKPVLSSGRLIGGFRANAQGRWEAKVEGARFGQLWVNGRRAVRSREPDQGFFRMKQVVEQVEGNQATQTLELAEDALACLRGLDATSLAGVEMLAYHKWDNTRRHIAAVTPAGLVTRGQAMKSWNRWDDKSGLVFENLPGGVDEPGEWHLSPAGVLTYLPRAGEDPASAEVIAPGLEQLLIIRGTAEQPVRHVEIRGLAFHHAGWNCPPEGFEPAQAAAPIEAVVQVDHAENLRVSACDIGHTGLYGLWFRAGCRDCALEKTRLHDLGAGGVRIGTMEMGRGTSAIAITDCIIADGGRDFPCAVGVWIGHSGDNVVAHNTIRHFPYTGVSVGWRWGYDASEAKRNRIEANHIHHIGNGLLSDMGGIYTLGPSEGTVLRGNRIHDIVSYDYGGWGLYNDEGSTGILMENNVVFRTTTGGYHQHYGRENIIRNNIFAHARDHQLQVTRVEDHLSFRFTGNIVIWEKGPLWSGGGATAKFESDRNLYHCGDPGGIQCFGMTYDAWRQTGRDRASVVADPGFRDARGGDFRFHDATTAQRIGFQTFDTTAAGVRGTADWKALAAETPPDWGK